MPSERIVDSHVHFFDPALLHYDWLDSVPAIKRRSLPADVDTGGYRVDGFVVVENDARTGETVAEVRWVAGLARDDPRVAGIVARVDLEDAEASRATLDAFSGIGAVVGVRRLLQDAPAGFTDLVAFRAGMAALSESRLPFDTCVRHWQLGDVDRLAADFPDVTFVLDHVGKPDIRAGLAEPWRSDIASLAKRPNVFCKLSGLTTEADHESWTEEQIRPYLLHAIDAFGPSRCMYGSDWPVVTLATTYVRWLELVLDVVSDLSSAERGRVLSATAAAVYGLDR
jgi:predicted TIM-barrel fold metal-dependent hydrolase